MNSKKLCRAAKFFAAQAGREQIALGNEGFKLYRDGRLAEAEQINQQVDRLESVVSGLSSLRWHLSGTDTVECRERVAMRYKSELSRYLADLYLETRDRETETANQLLIARDYVRQAAQPTISLLEPRPEPELVG